MNQVVLKHWKVKKLMPVLTVENLLYLWPSVEWVGGSGDRGSLFGTTGLCNRGLGFLEDGAYVCRMC